MSSFSSPKPVGLWAPCQTLWRREMVRFLRQRSRIIGALGTPVIFWLLMGAGLRQSLRAPGDAANVDYLEFSFGGAIAAILLFTAIFSMISLIDDRKEGFLQGVLVAPVSRSAIALGKVMGATTLAVGQAVIFLLLAPTAGIELTIASFVATTAAMVLIAFAVTSLGFWIAWRMESTQGFHAIMNLVLLPMLILSGAFFPPAGSAGWLRAIITCNPMTYAVDLIRHCLYYHHESPIVSSGSSFMMSLAVSVGFAAFTFFLAISSVTKESAKALQ